ncbi:MAG: 2-phospho-L-lactate guanylyltransferase [Candidatus Nitrosocaldaceae archaeon]
MICIVIPVKRLVRTKSRLAGIFGIDIRKRLTLYMLEDMLSIINNKTFQTIVVGYDDEVKDLSKRFDAIFIKDEDKGINEAISLTDDYCKRFDASIVIPVDLLLLTPIDLFVLRDIARYKRRGIVITPSSRLDGTNILLRKPPLVMKTYYDKDSYLIHINKALEDSLDVSILLNNRIMYDLDSIDDINYLVNHNINKKSVSYLKQLKL